jgi:sugar/nucleoside kinase (ribokinase family)
VTARITVAGTLTLDDVTTPWGRRREVVGGSALYTALAAAPSAPVRVVGVVGEDAADRILGLLRRSEIDVGDVDVLPGPTFRWRAVHDFERWVTAFEEVDEGVMAGWQPRLSSEAATSPLLFLGSMHPRLQRAVLDASHSPLIVADSMVAFIRDRREEVLEVVERSDVLVLNRSELAALAQVPEEAWLDAAKELCAAGRRVVVVKAGPEGAAAVTPAHVVRRPAVPVSVVVDPTGAGDALAGGMLGYLARSGRPLEDCLEEALAAGLLAASRTIVDFGPAGLVSAGRC